jgi:CBS domain-containing protein
VHSNEQRVSARTEERVMKIGELCNRTVVVMQPEEPVATAAELMRQHHVGSVVVVEGPSEGRRPVGIVTDRDIVLEVVARGLDGKRVPIAQIMAAQLWTAREDESAEDVLHKLAVHGVHRVPVVDASGTLQGIFAADDFVAWAQNQLVELAHVVERGLHRERHDRPTTAAELRAESRHP